MRIVKFDIDTYNLTQRSGSPVVQHVVEEYADLEMICDEQGNPTRGGVIGYWLAYAIMAAFIAALFYYL